MFKPDWEELGEILAAGVLVLGVFSLAGCISKEEADQEHQQSNENDKIDADMNKQGFTQVGTTPDGKPLYMKEITKGYLNDRVYFTDDTITAHEGCGKNCTKNITTIRH